MSIPKITMTPEDLLEHNKLKDSIFANINLMIATNKFHQDSWEYRYLYYLKDNIETVLTGDFIQISTIVSDLDRIHNFSMLKCNHFPNADCLACNSKKFSDELQEKLSYTHEKLVKYFLNSGCKACYVCNAQYTVTAQKDYELNVKRNYKKKYKPLSRFHITQSRNKAKFQLDHYYPKSYYPALSISLGNLYPICSSCNQTKSNNVYDISDLYTKVKFELDINSIRKYYIGESDLVLHISDRSSSQIASKFDIKGVYDNHMDTIEELFQRKVKYGDNYRNLLANKFPNIVGNLKNIDDRLIVGTYSLEEGYFKRPLSKFLHDINKQLDDFIK